MTPPILFVRTSRNRSIFQNRAPRRQRVPVANLKEAPVEMRRVLTLRHNSAMHLAVGGETGWFSSWCKSKRIIGSNSAASRLKRQPPKTIDSDKGKKWQMPGSACEQVVERYCGMGALSLPGRASCLS